MIAPAQRFTEGVAPCPIRLLVGLAAAWWGLALVNLTENGRAIGAEQSATAASPAKKAATDESLPANLASDNRAGDDRGSDWPCFLGPHGDNSSTETDLKLDWKDASPPVVWHTRVGDSYGICSISRGRCFYFERDGDTAKLVCRHSETGKLLWTYGYQTDYEDMYGYNNGPRCSPVIDGDRVYLYGAEGELHCVRISTAQKVWSVDTAAKFGVVQNFFGVGSSPVIEGDLLICIVGGSPPDDQNVAPGQLDEVSGNGSGIVAFDKYTGEVRYQLTDELASYAGIRLTSWQGRRWGFAFLRGGLVGFDPANGSVDFHYPWRGRVLESVNASTPVVVDNQVFISETYGPGSSLLEFQPGKYRVVWADDSKVRHRAMQTHWNTAIHLDGYLYGSSGRHSQNAELRCIEWSSGRVLWSEPGLTRCSLLAIRGEPDHLICLSEYGRLIVIQADSHRYHPVAEWEVTDPQTGQRLLQYPAWAAPILAHGRLYVRGSNQLVCLDLRPR